MLRSRIGKRGLASFVITRCLPSQLWVGTEAVRRYWNSDLLKDFSIALRCFPVLRLSGEQCPSNPGILVGDRYGRDILAPALL